MLCGLVPPTFALTALIEPLRLLAGGVVGFDESRRNKIDRADWLPASCPMVGDGLGIREAVLAVLRGGFGRRWNDVGGGIYILCTIDPSVVVQVLVASW